MGTGNKTDPTKFEITDIYKTSVCPLARVMRYEMKKRGVKKLKVLFSKEEPIKPSAVEKKEKGKAGIAVILFAYLLLKNKVSNHIYFGMIFNVSV